MYLRLLCLIFLVSFLVSCDNKKPAESGGGLAGKDSYYSIKRFAADQWSIFHGMPFGVLKVTYADGKVDSTYTDAFKLDWGMIFKVFFETDISDKKFLGHYDFTTFYDNATDTRNFFYEAKEENLFTRRLQISAADYDKPIQSVYIETGKKNGSGYRTQRLLYMPKKIISIQEFEQTSTGPGKEVRIEYHLL